MQTRILVAGDHFVTTSLLAEALPYISALDNQQARADKS
jgi:hypothetical protein